MAVMDEFREERDAIKNGTPREKWNYFWDYYKWHVIVTVLVIFLGFFTIREIMDRKDTALYACLLNTLALETAEQYNADFMESIGLDTSSFQMIFDSDIWIEPDSLDQATMTNSQKLAAHLAAGELDVMITDTGSITGYSYQENFLPMEELLSPEQYKRYQPDFYYIDLAAAAKWHDYITDLNHSALESDFDFPDPRKPEEMESPVAVGIFMDHSDGLKENYHFKSDDVVFCVFANSSRREAAVQYLEYLMQPTKQTTANIAAVQRPRVTTPR